MRHSPPCRSRQRGVSLLETVVAFFVLAAGSAAVAQLQGQLRLAGDLARERSEAVRLAEQAVEELRAFAVVDGPPGSRAYAAIANGSSVVAAASAAAHNDYRIERDIDDATFGAAKAARIAVRWSDRTGAARSIVVDSFVAAVDPAYSGSLSLETGAVAAAPRGAHDRKPGLPLTAKSLGDGSSVWKPRDGGTSAWLFDDRSGAIVGICEAIAATTPTSALDSEALRACTAGRWLFVGGTVRAAADAPAAIATLATGATGLTIELQDGVYPQPAACTAEPRKTVRFVDDGGMHVADVALDATPAALGVDRWEEMGDRFLAWRCAVAPREDGRWSGKIALVANGWTIGTGSAEGRVCRLAAGADRAAIDANIASAGIERDVDGALLGRSLLVVRGSDPCPSATTAPHQP
jgi:Tfp pilus assembly protein PilV